MENTWLTCAALCWFITLGGAQSFGQADLSMTLVASPTSAFPGTEIEFRGHVFNAGPQAAANVNLHTTLPERLLPVSATSTSGDSVVSDQQVSCTIPLIEPGTTATLQIVARLGGNGRGFTTVDMTARSGHPADPNLTNNSSAQTITIEWPYDADVGVSGSTSEHEISVFDEFVFELSTSCYGPDSAWDISSALYMPVGFDLVRATTSAGSEVTTTSSFAGFTIPTLNPGDSAKHKVYVRAKASGSFKVYWQIFRSSGGDWDGTNNHLVWDIPVLPLPSGVTSGWELYP